MASLEEIRRSWSLVDIAKAHQILDIQRETDAYYQQQAERNAKKKR